MRYNVHKRPQFSPVDEVSVEQTAPPCVLDSYGTDVWRLSVRAEHLLRIDLPILLAYVSACVRLKNAIEMLEHSGDYVTTPLKRVVRHPAVEVEQAARRDILALSNALQLSPDLRWRRDHWGLTVGESVT